MTQTQIQLHHHQMVREHRKQFNDMQEEFKEMTAKLTQLKNERIEEQWKLDNSEQIKAAIEYERTVKAQELEAKLREARNSYADKALSSGIDIDMVKEIFGLTDEEVEYI